MNWIKLLPNEEGIGKIGKEALVCFVLLFWPYIAVIGALSKGMVADPREVYSMEVLPKAFFRGFLAVIVAVLMRKLSGYKPSPYRYGWILTAIGMFLFPFVSLTRSQLVVTLFFILWYYLVIWTFSWEAAPERAKRTS